MERGLIMSEAEKFAIDRWNAQADKHNFWNALGGEEQKELIEKQEEIIANIGIDLNQSKKLNMALSLLRALLVLGKLPSCDYALLQFVQDVADGNDPTCCGSNWPRCRTKCPILSVVEGRLNGTHL
jgi:hypothetical protein